jgi:lipoprotein-anchoring transpeptidase ErfK/SrfK
MSRSHRPRTSRILLTVLGLTVAIGVFTFATRYRQKSTAIGAEPPASAAVAPVTLKDDPTPVSTRHQPETKPTTAPTTKPTQVAKTQNPATRPSIKLSSRPLIDAEALADAGQPLKARDLFNAALISGKLSADETRIAKEKLAALNESIVFSREPFEGDPWAERFTVPPNGVLTAIAKRYRVTPELLQRINGIKDARRLRADQKIKVLKGPLHAVVDKTDFTIDLYFGSAGGPDSSYITTFKVGLGKDNSTPTGKWLVEPGRKLTNPTYYSPPDRGRGVIDADDPKNPLGEFWIGLEGVEGQAVGKDSYGIHGTIEPETIGTMASMGCIRMRNEDVARVYEMLVEGQSTVVVTE